MLRVTAFILAFVLAVHATPFRFQEDSEVKMIPQMDSSLYRFNGEVKWDDRNATCVMVSLDHWSLESGTGESLMIGVHKTRNSLYPGEIVTWPIETQVMSP